MSNTNLSKLPGATYSIIHPGAFRHARVNWCGISLPGMTFEVFEGTPPAPDTRRGTHVSYHDCFKRQQTQPLNQNHKSASWRTYTYNTGYSSDGILPTWTSPPVISDHDITGTLDNFSPHQQEATSVLAGNLMVNPQYWSLSRLARYPVLEGKPAGRVTNPRSWPSLGDSQRYPCGWYSASTGAHNWSV